METYFNIKYEFDKVSVHKKIDAMVKNKIPAYICVADGNILTMVQHDKEYRRIINNSIFSICDSSWVPIFIGWIYGRKYEQYCGNDIFNDIVRSGKYRMIFLGAHQKTLNALKLNMQKKNPQVANMNFEELPFMNVDDFDYKAIASKINKDGADIIWIGLGAPKQEIFMNRLMPYLDKGVAIAVGAVFNFNSGLKTVPKRAPRWMIFLHLEFVHRIFTEPKKQIKRCWGIMKTLPGLLWKEYMIKKAD